MACSCLFKTKDERGWLKSWRAIFLTKEGLSDLVKSTMHSIYDSAVKSLPSGSLCPTSASGAAQHIKCDQHFETIIQKHHSQWHKMSMKEKWQNSDNSKLCSSEWEFAKCFIHGQGYKNKKSIEETDLNGMISIIRNCSEFQKYFSFKLTDRVQPLLKVNMLTCVYVIYMLEIYFGQKR